MKTFIFQDALITNTFTGNNSYAFGNIVETNVCFNGHDGYELFIGKGGICTGGIKVGLSVQFGDRALTNAKIEEILDSAKVPIRLSIKNTLYYIGKGIILVNEANANGTTGYRVLFAAAVPKDTSNGLSRGHVRFYIDKAAVKDEKFAGVRTVIKEVINGHIGEILYTENMKKYFPKFQFIPGDFRTITQVTEFKEELIRKSLAGVSQELKQKQNSG